MKKTLEQFKSMSKKNKIILVSILTGIILIFGATTYAFFSSTIDGDKQPLSVQTGTLILEFNDVKNSGVRDEEIALDNEITKEMVITNKGTLDATATIMWNELTNTYLDKSLKYTIKQTEGYNNDVVINADTLEYNEEVPQAGIYVPRSEESKKTALTREIIIPAGKKIYYRVTITYNHLDDVDQTSDLEAHLSTSFTIEEGNQLETLELTHLNRSKIGWTPETTDLIIPAIYEDENGALYKVELGSQAFNGCNNLNSVVIQDGITKIDDIAFSSCNNLTSVTIPDSVTNISTSAFSFCRSLTSINVNEGNQTYKSIDGVLFTKDGKTLIQCPEGISGSYVIPDSVTSIGNYAFDRCNNLTSVTIPDSVTSIGDHAFDWCQILRSITIPKNVTNIGVQALASGNLGSINVNEENQTYKSIDGVLFTKDGKTLIQCPSRGGNFIIPDGVTTIGDYAFESRIFLKSITIPNGVTSIGKSAFQSCRDITAINIPDSVTTIGDEAFWNCSSLTSITVPGNVTSIGYEVFYACYGLTSVTIENGITNIGDSSFKSCTRLTTIEIPNSLTSIGNSAFSGCSSLESIAIPDSVTSIGSSIFYNCSNLTSATVSRGIINTGTFSGCTKLSSLTLGSNVTSISDYAFSKFTNLTSVTIDGGSIGKYAFNECTNLTSVTIGNSVKSLGNYAFNKCTSLTSATIGSNNIGYNVFNGCSNLSSITLINGVTSIDDYVFADITSLTSIIIPDSVTNIGEGAFVNCTNLTSITIPNSVTTIGLIPFYYCTSLKSINVDEANTTYKSIDGVLYTKDGRKLIAFPNAKNTTYIIPDGVTAIEEYAFISCSNLTSITLSNSVTQIKRGAFQECNNLASIIYNGTTYTNQSTFTTAFTAINGNTIGSDAFYGTKL